MLRGLHRILIIAAVATAGLSCYYVWPEYRAAHWIAVDAQGELALAERVLSSARRSGDGARIENAERLAQTRKARAEATADACHVAWQLPVRYAAQGGLGVYMGGWAIFLAGRWVYLGFRRS